MGRRVVSLNARRKSASARMPSNTHDPDRLRGQIRLFVCIHQDGLTGWIFWGPGGVPLAPFARRPLARIDRGASLGFVLGMDLLWLAGPKQRHREGRRARKTSPILAGRHPRIRFPLVWGKTSTARRRVAWLRRPSAACRTCPSGSRCAALCESPFFPAKRARSAT